MTRGLAAHGAGAGVLRATFYLHTGALNLQDAMYTLCPSEQTSLLFTEVRLGLRGHQGRQGGVRLPNIIPYTIFRPLRAISGEVSLNAAQKTFAPQGAHPKHMARGRTQNANLLLASIRDLHLKFPNRKVTRDGLTADHAGHPHAVTNNTKMQPLTKRKTLNRPIQS